MAIANALNRVTTSPKSRSHSSLSLATKQSDVQYVTLIGGFLGSFLFFLTTLLRNERGLRSGWIDDSMAELPYWSTLRDFEHSEKILQRENIYGSGPPIPTVSEETLHYVREYAGKQVLDIGCGTGAYIKALLQEEYQREGVENNQDYVSECLKDGLKVKYMDAHQLKYSQKAYPLHSSNHKIMWGLMPPHPKCLGQLESSR